MGDEIAWLGEALKNGLREKREELVVRCAGWDGGGPNGEPPGDRGRVGGNTGFPHKLQPMDSIDELEWVMMVEAETGSMMRSPAMIA